MTSNRYFGFELNDNGTLRAFGADESEYQTDVLAVRADDIIRGQARNRPGQALFLYVATQAPHSGRNSNEIRDDPALAHARDRLQALLRAEMNCRGSGCSRGTP